MRCVEVDQLRVVYPNKDGDRVALDSVSLSIGHESVALLGPNGAGKSTLMGVLCGTVHPNAGSVHRGYENGLGMVFQTTALDELLTVRENLHLAGSLHGMSKDSIRGSTQALVETLGIADRIDQQVRRLSGGLKRRVDLARALLASPGLLLLDEPTTGLDVEARASLWSAIDSIRSRTPMAVLFATHLTEEASKADRVILMSDGKIVVDGSPPELIDALGDTVLRVRLREEAGFQELESWCKEIGCPCVHRGSDVLISHVNAQHVSHVPGDPISVTLAAPTLEDVYLWHARTGITQIVGGPA
jgi:ABC-type multidrug transport system ATPase subunit